jgi:GH25 family lysozyme M1 (1,4-beta-N-acetylmuramidase)
MKTFGVDVSHWEGIIDWKLAAPFIPFAYFKCTDGQTMFDNTFVINHLGCKSAGIPHVPYHYFQPHADPILQANHFVDKAGLDFKRYIVDVEEPPIQKSGFPEHLRTFLLRCQELTSIKPAIYTSAGFWNENVFPKPEWAKEYDLAVAHYTREHQPILPIGWTSWVIWQFTDYWFFPGCSSAADGNWFNGTLDQVRQWFGNYRSMEQEIDPPVYNKTQALSLFPDLHIRHLPSTLARQVGHLAKGEIVMINELGGKDVWIKHQRGWTCVEKDGYRYMEVIK